MAIATYADLQSAIADFLARSDLTARIPDFITLTEARLDRALKAYENQKSSTLSMTGGSVATPADYAEWISARWIGARTQDLTYAEPDSSEWRFRFRPNGDPQMFTIIAGNIEVRPGGGTDQVKLYYYFKLSSVALSAINTTNWLLTKCPDIYLHTALAEAQIYMKDESRAAEFLTLAKGDADMQNISADASKFKIDQSRQIDNGSSPIQMATRTPVGLQ